MPTTHTPEISVIVPMYNVEKFLVQCLESISAQTFADFEVLCINDGSTDGSADIARHVARSDSRFTVVDKPNGGYGSACNVGLSHARGRWISIIEPDDWIDPTMYEDMLAFRRGFADEVDVVKASWTDVFDWDDLQRMVAKPGFLSGRMPSSSKPARASQMPYLLEGHPSIWSALYRREFLDKNAIRFNEYPGAGWADNPFYLEIMCRAQSVVYLDGRYYNYRRDLAKPSGGTPSDAAISMPFDRWLDMLAILERFAADDRVMTAALHLRGMNYVCDAISAYGWDNSLVQAKTREVFSKMDRDVVLSHPKISGEKKRFFCTVTGIPYRPRALAGRAAYLVSELAFRMTHRSR